MSLKFGGKVLDITIDGSELGDPVEVNTYEREVLDQLRRVLDSYGKGQYKAGRWVLEELSKKLTIRPSLAQKRDASGAPVTGLQNHPVMITDLNASADPVDGEKAQSVGRIFGLNGLGSDVVIRYSPSAWWYVDARRVGIDASKHRYVQLGPDERFHLSSDKLAAQPDDILLHELFHAYRQMNGLWLKPDANTFDSDYGKKEEFFAVVVTNIYVSERNTSYQPRALRGKYTFQPNGTQPIFRDLENDSQFQDPDSHHFSTKRFYDRYESAIGEMVSDMNIRFRNRMSSVKAQFNPIALWTDKHPNG